MLLNCKVVDPGYAGGFGIGVSSGRGLIATLSIRRHLRL